ncbi:MAG: hypothetical protein R6U17_00150 [Thermoplasmata archaeon]
MINYGHRYEQFTFRSYVDYFADPDPLDFDHEHDASGDGISDADTYWLSSDPLIDGRAHPLRKDVFVEVDRMEGVDRLSDEAKWRIGTRFYENDIWLHIDDGKMGGGGEVPYISTIYNNHDNEALTLDGYQDAYFTPEREGLFRYGLMADYVYVTGEDRNVLGFARPGRFVVSQKTNLLLDYLTNPGTVFMHELGHTLGLWTDVFDGIDNCPIPEEIAIGCPGGGYWHSQYPSVMNYYTLVVNSSYYDYSDGSNSDVDHNDWAYIKESLKEGI